MIPKIKKTLIDYRKDSYATSGEEAILPEVHYVDCELGFNPFGNSKLLKLEKDELESIDFSLFPKPDSLLIHGVKDFWSKIVNLNEQLIKLEAGTFGVIERINKLFVNNEWKVLGYCPQFADYTNDVICNGGQYESVKLKPELKFKIVIDELVEALDANKYNLLYIDNPNNPTGQVIPIIELERVIKKAEKMNIAVLIDEAYGDYMPKDNSAVTLINSHKNLFVARSFSKGLGLCGLRAGYVVFSEEMKPHFEKVEHPFPLNCMGMRYATKALQDENFINNCRIKIKEIKLSLMNVCKKLIVMDTDPHVPIMLIAHPNEDVNLYNEFLKRRIITASGTHFEGCGQNYVRLRVPSKDIDTVIKAIEDIEQIL